MDRNRRLAELMGMQEWLCRMYLPTPDFSDPEWRARLMDLCVGKEWWGDFKGWVFDKMTERGEYGPGGSGDFTGYLWRNFVSLMDGYWQERGK